MIKKQFLIPKGASADGTLRPMQGNALLLPTITVSFAMLLKSLFYPWKKINWNPRCTLAKKVKKKNRLQNSLYFCVFKYAQAVKQKVWNEAENRERDWGEVLWCSRASRA